MASGPHAGVAVARRRRLVPTWLPGSRPPSGGCIAQGGDGVTGEGTTSLRACSRLGAIPHPRQGGHGHVCDLPPNALSYRDLVVYGTSDGARCRQVRSLIATRGYVYQDVRVDEDLSTRSWLQRLTGDDALPKVCIGQKCYGGFEDIQRFIFDGRFDGILRGEADEANGKDEIAALKKEMSAAAISTLMCQGEILTITEGEMVRDAWAEPFANPPLVYHEGTPHPIDELATIVGRIMTRLKAGEIEISWKADA